MAQRLRARRRLPCRASIETAQGRSIVARVVTYGTEQDPNDIDVSPSVLRITGMDGQSVTQDFASFSPGSVVTLEMQFE